MKEIKLTQGQFSLVDDEDFEWLNQWKWYARKDYRNGTFYAVRDVYLDSKKVQIQMHRRILECPANLEVDHINHNTLDNQRSNLRLATRKQNSLNRKLALPSSGVRGIQKTPNGTYRAGAMIGDKYRYFPTRKTLEEAIADRNGAVQNHYSPEFLPKD